MLVSIEELTGHCQHGAYTFPSRTGGSARSRSRRWPGFFLPVRVLSRLFRRLFLEKLVATHAAGRLQVFGAAPTSRTAMPSQNI
jgi:hypothetical protein